MTWRKLLGTDVPILQAPMAGVQGHELAAAVSRAGGLGALPCALLTPDALRAELTALRAQTERFNLNFFCHASPIADAARDVAWRAALAPYYRELAVGPATAPTRLPFDDGIADVVESFRPAFVSFHFGLPSPALVARVRSWGTRILATATTVEEARWLESHGADAVIAQGWEAGGHRGSFLDDGVAGQLGTFVLVPEVVAAVRIPVIAAGGIADAIGVRAALTLGATAVQVGTAFLRCPEATTSALHRAALVTDVPTAMTNLFTGRPARGLVNRLMRELGPLSPLPPAFPLAAAALAPLRAKAESQGSGDFSPLWSGQNRSGCRDVPAAEIVRALSAGT
jgi:nitronate monooxygenase